MDIEYEQVSKSWNHFLKTTLMKSKLDVRVGAETVEIPLIPSSFLTKLRLSLSGGYITIQQLQVQIRPLVSKKSGVSGKMYIRDISDMTGVKLHMTDSLILGREVRLNLRHIDYSLANSSDVPIVFGFEDVVSPYAEARELFRVSLSWHFALSSQPLVLPSCNLKVQYLEEALKDAKIANSQMTKRLRKKTMSDEL